MRGKFDSPGAGWSALTDACVQRRWWVILLWAVGVAGLLLLASTAGTYFSLGATVPGSDSDRAIAVAGRTLPGGVPDIENIVLKARSGTLDTPLVRSEIAAMSAAVAKVPGVTGVVDPYNALGTVVLGVAPISADRTAGIESVLVKGSPLHPNTAVANRLIATARAFDTPNLQVELDGPDLTARNATAIRYWPFLQALGVSLLALIVALRSRAGVLIPLVSAVVAAAVAVGLVGLVSHLVLVTVYAPLLAGVVAAGASLGGAVVACHRVQVELRRDATATDAAIEAARSVARPVAAGGFCVAGAMAVVAALHVSGYGAAALGPALAGATTGLVMTTLLPAMLAVSGSRLLDWTERQHVSQTGTALIRKPGNRAAWAALVQRWPKLVALAAAALLLALAVPATMLKLGGSDDGVDQESLTSRRAYDLVSEKFFPGLNGTMLVAVDSSGVTGRKVSPAALVTAIGTTPGVVRASLALDNPKTGTAVIRVAPMAAPRTAQAEDLVRALRTTVLPKALAGTGSRAFVGGATAVFLDSAASFSGATTEFLLVALVALLVAGVLLLRSWALAVVVAVSTVLVALASGGVLALLFQTQSLAGLLGLKTASVQPSLLVLVLAGGFGLTPGLNLYLLTRLRERGEGVAVTRSGRRLGAPRLIRGGHAEVGYVVLLMNMIMINIFVALVQQPTQLLKVIGAGLAAGIALDAYIVRATLLPAVLHLLPERRTGAARHRGASTRQATPPGPAVAVTDTADWPEPATGPIRARVPAGDWPPAAQTGDWPAAAQTGGWPAGAETGGWTTPTADAPRPAELYPSERRTDGAAALDGLRHRA